MVYLLKNDLYLGNCVCRAKRMKIWARRRCSKTMYTFDLGIIQVIYGHWVHFLKIDL